MSATILLDSIIAKEKPQYPAGLSDDQVFEFYCADNILVNYDLDDDEIHSGIIDGPRDAGVDAAYVFINSALLTDDFDFGSLRQPVELELYIIQAKNQDNFKEAPVDKLAASLPILLDHTKKPAELEPLFKKEVVAAFSSFLEVLKKVADKFPKVSIKLFYCSRGGDPNATTKAKAETLEKTVKGLHFANVQFNFLGAQQLYERSAVKKRLVRNLSSTGTPISGKNSFVALCKLKDYLSFVSDESGNLVSRIFEANVRAYQGEVEVNKEIAESLENGAPDLDFWWLNNGVTIVADEASYINNQIVIANPLVVNGLQTSHEIHACAAKLAGDQSRSILIRVISETDPTKRDKIIRATNRQTGMSSSSFRATEPVHREIEEYFQTFGLYYDRRKNFYKREGKPADKIISIDRLAQSVLSVLLQQPHTARARPTTAIKEQNNYLRIFSGDKAKHPLEMYGVIVQLLDFVEQHFRGLAGQVDRVYRYNLKFHTLMVVSWAIQGATTLPALAIPKLDVKKATPAQLKAVTDWLFAEFSQMGAEDRTAKDSSFTDRLKTKWQVANTKV